MYLSFTASVAQIDLGATTTTLTCPTTPGSPPVSDGVSITLNTTSALAMTDVSAEVVVEPLPVRSIHPGLKNLTGTIMRMTKTMIMLVALLLLLLMLLLLAAAAAAYYYYYYY